MTTPAAPRRPPGRYDEPRPASRWAALAFALVFATVIALVAVKVWRQYTSDVRVQARGFAVSSPREVTVQYDVRMAAGRTARCRLRALDRDRAVTGSAVVDVGPLAPGARSLRVGTRLPTAARAVTAEVLGCRLQPVGARSIAGEVHHSAAAAPRGDRT